MHHAWQAQGKRVLAWLLKLFFGCTVGFSFPAKELLSLSVLQHALVYFCAIVGKLMQGVFAKPLSTFEFFKVGLSMSAWGEFAFMLAGAGRASGALSDNDYAEVMLAVLLSILWAPFFLRLTLARHEAKVKHDVALARLETSLLNNYHDVTDPDNPIDPRAPVRTVPVYYCLRVKARESWGSLDRLLSAVAELQLHVLDLRVFHPHYRGLDVPHASEMYHYTSHTRTHITSQSLHAEKRTRSFFLRDING